MNTAGVIPTHTTNCPTKQRRPPSVFFIETFDMLCGSTAFLVTCAECGYTSTYRIVEGVPLELPNTDIYGQPTDVEVTFSR